MNPQAAIIIPTLNEERHIGRCLASLAAQTFPLERMEVLVVDGGSADGTQAAVRTFAEAHPTVRWVDNPGRIQAAAFNLGVKQSSAPFILRLDAHAEYDSRYVQTCLEDLQAEPSAGNVGGVVEALGVDGPFSEAYAIASRTRFGIGGAAFRVGSDRAWVDTVPFGAFRRSTVEAVGSMREDLPRAEDNEYNARIRASGLGVLLDPRIRSRYFVRSTPGAAAAQMEGNGGSIARLLRTVRGAVGLRHLVPLAFLLALGLSLLCLPLCPWPLYLTAGAYLLADAGACLAAACRYGAHHLKYLPWLYPLLHLSYGWGTLKGLLQKND